MFTNISCENIFAAVLNYNDKLIHYSHGKVTLEDWC